MRREVMVEGRLLVEDDVKELSSCFGLELLSYHRPGKVVVMAIYIIILNDSTELFFYFESIYTEIDIAKFGRNVILHVLCLQLMRVTLL